MCGAGAPPAIALEIDRGNGPAGPHDLVTRGGCTMPHSQCTISIAARLWNENLDPFRRFEHRISCRDLLDGFNIPAVWADQIRSEPAGADEIAFNIPVLEKCFSSGKMSGLQDYPELKARQYGYRNCSLQFRKLFSSSRPHHG